MFETLHCIWFITGIEWVGSYFLMVYTYFKKTQIYTALQIIAILFFSNCP